MADERNPRTLPRGGLRMHMEAVLALLYSLLSKAGDRPDRLRAGKGAPGFETIDSVCAQVQEEFLKGFGLAEPA